MSPLSTGVAPALDAPQSPLWTVWDFLVHVTVGSAIFVVIAGVAVLLNVGVHRLDELQVDEFIKAALKLAEYAILATDLVLFLIFLCKTGYRTAKRL